MNAVATQETETFFTVCLPADATTGDFGHHDHYLRRQGDIIHPKGTWCFSADRALAFSTWGEADKARKGVALYYGTAQVKRVTVNVRNY